MSNSFELDHLGDAVHSKETLDKRASSFNEKCLQVSKNESIPDNPVYSSNVLSFSQSKYPEANTRTYIAGEMSPSSAGDFLGKTVQFQRNEYCYLLPFRAVVTQGIQSKVFFYHTRFLYL